MKKFLPYIIAFIFVIGFFTPAAKLNAETLGTCSFDADGVSATGPNMTFDACKGLSGEWKANPATATTPAGAGTKTGIPEVDKNTAAKAASTKEVGLDCGLTNVMCMLASFSLFIMYLAGRILWLSGTLLNIVLDLTVIQLAKNIAGMTGIDVTWRIIRDVVNILFIFILVFEGIRIILNRSTPGKALTMIGSIILTAVLINFSVFFTKVIIDASNVATIGFYSSIEQAGKDVDQTIKTGEGSSINGGISGAFVNALKLTSLFNPDTVNEFKNNNEYQSIGIIGLGGAILFIILAFVFFAVSAMFVIRYITFIVLIMFSPLGFIFGIPKLQDIQSQWWKTLTGQAIFAPLYMFMTWVVLTLISSEGFIKAAGITEDASFGKLLGKTTTPPTSSVGLIINFAIVIGLAIYSLIVAKKYASDSSGVIANATGKLTSFAGGAVLGAGAIAGRNTIGRFGNMAANSDTLKDLVAKDGLSGIAGRLALRTSGKAAGSTFDARESLNKASSSLGVATSFGKGGKTSYKSARDQSEKDKVALAEKLKSSKAPAAKEQVDNANQALANKERERKDVDARNAAAKEEYKNSPEYKKLQEAENLENTNNNTKQAVVKTEIDQKAKLDKELADIEAKRKSASYTLDTVKRKEIDDEIAAKKFEIENQKKKIEEVRAANAQETTAKKAREDALNNFQSEEKKKFEADIATLKKLKSGAEQQSDALNKAYQDRVQSYAGSVENAWLKRLSVTIAGGLAGGLVAGPLGAGVGTALGNFAGGSSEENAAAALKIRATLKNKSTEAQIADLLKKQSEEAIPKPAPEPAPTTPTP